MVGVIQEAILVVVHMIQVRNGVVFYVMDHGVGLTTQHGRYPFAQRLKAFVDYVVSYFAGDEGVVVALTCIIHVP